LREKVGDSTNRGRDADHVVPKSRFLGIVQKRGRLLRKKMASGDQNS